MTLKELEAIRDFNEHKFVIRMNEPEDWMRHQISADDVVNSFILPRGPRQKDEMSDAIYHKDAVVHYHWHENGFETFEIARGSVECVIGGQRFIAQTGDLLHIPPYTSHAFHHLEEGNVWREMFQEINMAGGIFEKGIVSIYYEQMKDDPEFMNMLRGGKNLSREEGAIWDHPLVDHSKVFHCRTPEFAWETHEGEGYSLRLKIARWETAGLKEIWHVDLKKGLKAEYKYPHKGYEQLYVKKGKLEVTVDCTYGRPEPFTFVVEGDNILNIPPYHCYTIRVLEDTTLYNYGGEHELQNFLEDLHSVEKAEPERLADPKARLAFMRKYGVYATSFTYEKG